MSRWTTLETPNGPVRAWRVDPGAPAHAGVLVIQEIFGVNAHIRSVAERLSSEGYVALAPAVFDPVERDVELDYDAAGIQRGRSLVAALGTGRAIDVLDACAQQLQMEGLRVGAIGFCWGGTLAFLCSTRLGLPAVDYYGAPLMCHFGGRDESIPPGDIALHRQKQPQAQVFEYPEAGHAFNRDADPKAFEPASAALAWQRTLDFLGDQLR
jgi:carboxymethylenebutenolidase